jgi:hypothetical protein
MCSAYAGVLRTIALPTSPHRHVDEAILEPIRKASLEHRQEVKDAYVRLSKKTRPALITFLKETLALLELPADLLRCPIDDIPHQYLRSVASAIHSATGLRTQKDSAKDESEKDKSTDDDHDEFVECAEHLESVQEDEAEIEKLQSADKAE